MTYSKEKGVISETSVKVESTVDNVECEVEGILGAFHLLCNMSIEDSYVSKFYVLTHCGSTLDVLVDQSHMRKNLEELENT